MKNSSLLRRGRTCVFLIHIGLCDEIRQLGYKRIEQAFFGIHLWSPSYFAGSCGGAPLAKIKEYIANQKTPD